MRDTGVNVVKRSEGSGSTKRVGWAFYAILGLVAVAGIVFLMTAGGGDGGGELTSPLPAWAETVEPDPAAGVALGPADAPVTIMEFADYQCPHCAQFGTFTGRLLRQNYVEGEGLVRWVLYDYLVGFPNDVPAAIAARCAGEQGRHWEMHDLLLARQNGWGPSDSPGRLFRDYAADLGLDGGAFGACLEERRPLDDVLASHAYGESLGVSGTPTLFLNGRRLDTRTETSYEGLERLILAAADSARAAAAEGAAAGGSTDGTGGTAGSADAGGSGGR